MSDRRFIGQREAPDYKAEPVQYSAPPRVGFMLRDLSAECHAANAHWWTDLRTGERLHRNLEEMMCLVVSEVAEAMEGERKNSMDTHLTSRPMAEVELADVLIRVFDIAGAYSIDLDTLLAGHFDEDAHCGTTLNWLASYSLLCQGPPSNRGSGLYRIMRAAASVWNRASLGPALAGTVFHVLNYAGFWKYDLDGAVAEKRAYNATRADHKAAARLAPGGKAF